MEGMLVAPFVITFVSGLKRTLPTKYSAICALQIIGLALRVPVFVLPTIKSTEKHFSL